MASQEQEIRYPDYPLFKGLQKPLEFMGFKGAISIGLQELSVEPLSASS